MLVNRLNGVPALAGRSPELLEPRGARIAPLCRRAHRVPDREPVTGSGVTESPR